MPRRRTAWVSGRPRRDTLKRVPGYVWCDGHGAIHDDTTDPYMSGTPIWEALLDKGWEPERVRRVVHYFTRRLRDEMVFVSGPHRLAEWELDAEEAIARHGGAIIFQVEVITTEKGSAGTPIAEHIVNVLARGPDEARLLAKQIAACRFDMPLSSRVITDSTLTIF